MDRDMDYDKITIALGEFGKYQLLVFVMVCLSSAIVGMNMLSYVFNSAVPHHRCFIKNCDNRTTSFIEPWLNVTIPTNNGTSKFSQCSMYEKPENFTLGNMQGFFANCPARNTSFEVPCSKWKYDNSIYSSTVVTEWNLVCDKDMLVPLSGSLWMVGVIIGAALFGIVSDRFGRRKTTLISIILCFITGFIIPFSPNYEFFLFIRIFQAAATTGIYQTCYVLGLEIMGQSKRVFCGIGISIAFALGEIFLGVMALLVRDWQRLQIYLALPCTILLSYYWILPESPRWLISQKRYQEAKAQISTIAKYNGVSIPAELLETSGEFDHSTNSITVSFSGQLPKRSVNTLDLFRTPRIRWRTINIFLNWIMNTIGFYGLTMNATNLQGDVYVDFILTSVVEIPAYVFCWLVVDRFGRKWPLIGCMVVGGASCILTIAVPSNLAWPAIMLSLIGKFGSAAAFSIIYIFSIELFPTVLRNNGIGWSSFCAHIGGALAPYIASLAAYGNSIPLLIFGCSSLSAGLLAYFLPETLNKKLPETVKDAEDFGSVVKNHDKSSQEESEALI